MLSFKKRTPYRITLGILAGLSLVAVLDCYVSHTINLHYFPAQSHDRDFIPMIFFAVTFAGLLLEAISLNLFKRFTAKQNEESA